ncbi:hypothetical protein GQ602_003988 [Ophiocordyceps camponoti-floridani]|uniref:Uncharacterized protein n=1 Tax=Ophiocordyceps camponoti-floridani TaxID=2030778 RepID=A0A8H4Q612_9HYPO|nr:hypothetical protein GQ602_003988 [Ophiocordyceps camponoti-floridani]
MLSPSSTVRINRLSPEYLSRFARGNDRLSFLRSSSSASAKGAVATDGQDAVDEASTAISRWRDERLPLKQGTYNRYEFVDSSEALPGNPMLQNQSTELALYLGSSNQQQDLDGTLSVTAVGNPHDAATESKSDWVNPNDGANDPKSIWDSSTYVKSQYDGVVETIQQKSSRSTSVVTPPPPSGYFKRKATQLSFAGFSLPDAKRRRLASLRKWATKLYHGGGRRLSRAYNRWRQQNEVNRKQFHDWRANRRRDKTADPVKGKSERVFGLFSIDRRGEEWWKEGVAKFQAPSWMHFQK